MNLTTTHKLLILAVLWVMLSGGGTSSSSVTALTYVYEKGDSPVPPPVIAALDKLNRREPKVLATLHEVDTTDGTGQVPDQYKVAVDAAKAAGMPAAVAEAKGKVKRVVKDPKTEEQVLEAAK